MAKPIPMVLKAPQVPNEKDVRDELRRKLDEAPIEHAAALLSAYELLQALHDRGALGLIRGFVGASDEIVGLIASALASPKVIRGLRNLIALSELLAGVDPRVFEGLRDAFAEAADKNLHADGKPPGLWTICKRADSENSLRALAMATDFLDSFGRHLKQNSAQDGHSSI